MIRAGFLALALWSRSEFTFATEISCQFDKAGKSFEVHADGTNDTIILHWHSIAIDGSQSTYVTKYQKGLSGDVLVDITNSNAETNTTLQALRPKRIVNNQVVVITEDIIEWGGDKVEHVILKKIPLLSKGCTWVD